MMRSPTSSRNSEHGRNKMKFEITVELPNGDWAFWRNECTDFQDACEQGIQSAKLQNGRLIRVEQIL